MSQDDDDRPLPTWLQTATTTTTTKKVTATEIAAKANSAAVAAMEAMALQTAEDRPRLEIFRNALFNLEQLTNIVGLDLELEKDDIRLQGPEFEPENDAIGLLLAQAYAHPNLKAFPDEESKKMARSNYEIIYDSLSANYCIHEAWKVLGFDRNPVTSTHPSIISQGTREKDGISPELQPDTISFHVLDDMFPTWLADHQAAIGCTFLLKPSTLQPFSTYPKMFAKTSRRYDCSCSRTRKETVVRGGVSRKPQDLETNAVDCKAQFMAFAGISKPIYGDEDGKMVDVTLIVYKFDHKHALRGHVKEINDRKKKRDQAMENINREELDRELRKEQLTRHVSALLVWGTTIQDVGLLLGMNAKRCRELMRARGGQRRFLRSDFVTRRDILGAMRQLTGVDDDENQGEVMIPVKQKDVAESKELQGERGVVGDGDVVGVVEDASGTESTTDGEHSEQQRSIDNPLYILRRYLDECDDNVFAPWMYQVIALVSNLSTTKRLPERPPDQRAKRSRP